MLAIKPPNAVAIEVVAAKPSDADRKVIEYLSARDGKELHQVVYLVKIRFKTIPPVTSAGWALYVGDFRVPKYFEYEAGIYFTVHDGQFFSTYKGKKLRFSQNGRDFVETGLKLEAPKSIVSDGAKNLQDLPVQSAALKATPAASRKTTAKPSNRPVRPSLRKRKK